jgi:hypothetical protein
MKLGFVIATLATITVARLETQNAELLTTAYRGGFRIARMNIGIAKNGWLKLTFKVRALVSRQARMRATVSFGRSTLPWCPRERRN